MDCKTINPLWNLADPLTVYQAAALVAGFDPNVVHFNADNTVWLENDTGQSDSVSASQVATAFAALSNAIWGAKLKVKVVHDSRPVTEIDCQSLADMDSFGDYLNPGFELIAADDETFTNGYFVKNEPNLAKTLISVEELRWWLKSKGFCTGFFFPTSTGDPDYLDPKNQRYAPKLAAAVRAWQSATESSGRHPKQVLAKWLREHAVEFGMTDDEGKPNETGIEETAKVANWQPGGGAPKTP